MFAWIKARINVVLMVMVAFALVASNSFATVTGTMADVFGAVDTTNLAIDVGTIIVALIGVRLLFVAAKYVKKALSVG